MRIGYRLCFKYIYSDDVYKGGIYIDYKTAKSCADYGNERYGKTTIYWVEKEETPHYEIFIDEE